MPSNVSAAWDRLENWIAQHCPDSLDSLRAGASKDEIATAEATLGQALPEDVRESLSLHDGQYDEGDSVATLFGLTLLPLEDIVVHWEHWMEGLDDNKEFSDGMQSFPEGAIQLDYINRGWIPLSRDGGGNHIGVDLAPGPNGTKGQIINFGRDEREKCVLAPSWSEFLSDYADFLEMAPTDEVAGIPLQDVPEVVFEARFDQSGHSHDVLRKLMKAGHWPPRLISGK